MNQIIKVLVLLKNNTEANTLDEAITFCTELYNSNKVVFEDMSTDEVIDKLTGILNQ